MSAVTQLDDARFATDVDRHLAAVTRRRGPLGPPQVLVRSRRHGLDYRFGDQSTRFHTASIGKLFTATLAMQLVEAGAFTVDTPIARLLPAAELRGLFVIDGTDRADQVTVDDLLAHTSGVADYFEGPVVHGPRFLDLVLNDPDHLWTPAELLDFSRDRQRPVGRPGARFAYSDTGYILLGRIIEEAAGSAFHDVLHERILRPLGMRDSALLFHSLPECDHDSGPTLPIHDLSVPDAASARSTITHAPAIAPFRLGRTEASRFTSISCDWAGGGVISTTDDLAVFSAALHGGELISAASFAHLGSMRNRFRPGIRYGAGMMQVRFEGFMPLLRALPRPVGHIGVLATHLFHDPVHDADIVLNFASTREMVRSFRTLITIEQALVRASRPRR